MHTRDALQQHMLPVLSVKIQGNIDNKLCIMLCLPDSFSVTLKLLNTITFKIKVLCFILIIILFYRNS